MMRLYCHLGLHDDALECRLIGVDRDLIGLHILWATVALQVVVVNARQCKVLRLVAHAAVTDVTIAVTRIGERRSRRLPRWLFSDRRQRWLVVQVRVLHMAVRLLATRSLAVKRDRLLLVVA